MYVTFISTTQSTSYQIENAVRVHYKDKLFNVVQGQIMCTSLVGTSYAITLDDGKILNLKTEVLFSKRSLVNGNDVQEVHSYCD